MTDLEAKLNDSLRWSYGRMAYNAYVSAAGGHSLITGQQLPVFSELDPRVRDAWIASAEAVRQQVEVTETEKRHDH